MTDWNAIRRAIEEATPGRRNWRCRIGLHYPALWDSTYSYDEPPDPWWHCGECEVDVYPLRWRPGAWFWGETRLGEWLIERDIRKRDKEYRKQQP